MTIKVLDKDTANKIAAGEVITDPAAVIKELVENSIDAHSSRIDISIQDGGKKNITITDNGDGILSNEVYLAFDRHATSKIIKLEDLYELTSLGFRGEALASIAAISQITMKTQARSEELGSFVKLNDHNKDVKRKSFSRGTSIIVEELFYNTPARLKHMKKGNELSKDIIQLVENLALSHPDISFSLTVEGKTVMKTPGDENLHNCIYSIFGVEFGDNLLEINYENKPLTITGYLGKPSMTRNNRKHQYLYINNRYVQDFKIAKAVEEAYESAIMINQHPVFVLNIYIPPHMLDVNVHPSKTKIKILNESLILILIKDGIRKKIRESSTVKSMEPKVSTLTPIKEEYVQEEIKNTSPDRVEEIISNLRERVSTPKDTLPQPTFIEQKKTVNAKVDPVKIESQISLQENQAPYMSSHEVSSTTKPKNNLQGLEFSQSFKHTNLVGQLFATYILFEGQDFILLMDQHAAHERVLYEEISKNLKNGEQLNQQIMPMNIQLSPSEVQLLMNNEEVFTKIGFEFEEFGNNTVCLRGVPLFLNKVQDSTLLVEIIEEMETKVNMGDVTKFEEAIIKSACKKAIKANKKLSHSEIYALIEQLVACHYPYTCPHGRPTLLRLTKYEFEKQFKRIQ